MQWEKQTILQKKAIYLHSVNNCSAFLCRLKMTSRPDVAPLKIAHKPLRLPFCPIQHGECQTVIRLEPKAFKIVKHRL